MSKKNDNIERTIEIGSSMAGSLLGSATGDPISGALLGEVSGKGLEILLKNIKREISAWRLRPREEARVLNAVEVALTEIQRRLDSGEELRKDRVPSDKAEVTESVLMKAQREPEEKKIRYMGYLIASSYFNPPISEHMQHDLAKAAEQLTYRQLCILKLCAVKDNYELRDKNYRECELESLSNDLYEVLRECADLHNREYIHSGLDTATMEMNVLSRLRSIVPSDMAFHTIGDYLYNRMKLSQIPDEDIAPIAEQLR